MTEATESVFEVVKRLVTLKSVVWSFLVIAVLASVARPPIRDHGDRGEINKQMSEVRQLALALRDFASENDGNFPATLDELYPFFHDKRSGFETDFTLSGKVERYWYCPLPADLDDTARPQILAPPPPQGARRVVGFFGGSAKVLRDEDFESLAINLPDWIR